MAWPKIIVVRGVQISVDSWEELDEAVQRYGGEPLILTSAAAAGDPPKERRERDSQRSSLSPSNRVLLQKLVEGGPRGVLTTEIGPVLGAKGKGIRPALESWGREIGLATTGTAFAPVRRNDGRAYRLTEVHLRAAANMLGASSG